MECRSLAEGGPRVKFSLTRLGSIADYFYGSSASNDFCVAAMQLTDALKILTESGATPVLPDGKLAGNGSIRIVSGDRDYLLVSKSGKIVGETIDPEKDTCIVTRFSSDTWAADYYSCTDSVLPTSDTPLHHCILHTCKQLALSEAPMVALHGHAIDSIEDAKRLNLPCSIAETLFSTPDDLHALLDLVGLYTYPQNKVFIRRGHGFFILGSDIPDALQTFRSVLEPYLKTQITS